MIQLIMLLSTFTFFILTETAVGWCQSLPYTEDCKYRKTTSCVIDLTKGTDDTHLEGIKVSNYSSTQEFISVITSLVGNINLHSQTVFLVPVNLPWLISSSQPHIQHIVKDMTNGSYLNKTIQSQSDPRSPPLHVDPSPAKLCQQPGYPRV